MKNGKGIALVISLVLIITVVLPGTLAISADQTSSDAAITVFTEASTTVSETAPPAEESNPTDSPLPSESEKPAETEKPAVYSHIDTCSDDCTAADCKCTCHLFDRLMACRTPDELWALLDAASEDALNALTDEQCAKIDAKIEALEPAPAPAIVIEESEPPVPSETDYAMISYTNVAPLGSAITGQHQ